MNTTNRTKLATLAAFAFVATASAFYNPEVGRWLSRDPIGERGGRDLYEFACNNPVVCVDNLGREPMLPPGWTGPGQPYDPTSNPFELPWPNPFPGPHMGPDDTLPEGFTGFTICQRPLNEEDSKDRCANKCGHGHKFLMYIGANGQQEGYGFYPNNKVNKEKLLSCPRAAPCKRTNSQLQYGIGKTKSASSATDQEVLDCIKSRPPLGPYGTFLNDCRQWPAKTASDCGLDCQAQSKTPPPPSHWPPLGF